MANWGSSLKSAFNDATSAAKRAFERSAKAVRDTGEYIRDKTIQGGKYVSEKAVEAGEFVAETAVETGEFIADKAVQGGEYVKGKAFDAGNFVIQARNIAGGFLSSTQVPIPAEPCRCRLVEDCIQLSSSLVNGLNLDTLGTAIAQSGDFCGYDKTDYGYVQSDPSLPGPDYLLLIEDPNQISDIQKHYLRNVELARLIKKGKIPTKLEDFYESDSDSYRLLPEGKSAYHMNGDEGRYNIKLVNKENRHGYGPGELEVVYSTVTGELDLSPENMPTLNIAGPEEAIAHTTKDVVPYWKYKNTPHDSTSAIRRRIGPKKSSAVVDPRKSMRYQEWRNKLGENG